jgi:hypothetical protein
LSFLDNDSFFLDGALSVPEIELRAGAAAKSQTPQELVARMREGGFQLLQVPGFLKDYKPLFLLEHEDFPKCFELLQTFPSGYKLFALKQEASSC